MKWGGRFHLGGSIEAAAYDEESPPLEVIELRIHLYSATQKQDLDMVSFGKIILPSKHALFLAH